MQSQAARHTAQTAVHLRPDGVLMVRFAGPLTGAALAQVKRDIAGRFAGQQVFAFLVDYTRAAVALSAADLDAVLEGERHGSVPSMPAAMVVPPPLVKLFDGHCLRMAQEGIVRRTFTELAPALEWAARHALRARTRT